MIIIGMGRAILCIVLVFAVIFISGCAQKEQNVSTPQPSPVLQASPAQAAKTVTDLQTTPAQPAVSPVASPLTFSTPKKSAHWEGNMPEHGSTIPAPPVNVVIDANFDFAPPSSISITKDGKEYGTGDTVIDKNKLAMRRPMDAAAADGIYTVNYNACWPDGSCHQGYFQFAIDRSKASEYQDLRGKPEVTISLSEIQFKPAKIRVSKGTKVIWKNDDSVVHYVNTDLHPSHTYLAEQNSKALNKGDAYEFTFTTPGFYPYHCSAHADSMKAEIIVE